MIQSNLNLFLEILKNEKEYYLYCEIRLVPKTFLIDDGGNRHPYPNPHSTSLPHTNIHKNYLKRSFFSLFNSIITDRRMDEASYRVACPQL